jgi:crossover junction endodeoxyribonuclease RuvC
LAIVGYGCIDVSGNRLQPVEYGVLRTGPEDTLAARLALIFEGCAALFSRLSPDEAAVEELFWGKNVTTGMTVSHARGVILLALEREGFVIHEYTPMVVKQTVTGDGRADKAAVQLMVQRILGLDSIPRPDDAADGLALAICHAQHAPLAARLRVLDAQRGGKKGKKSGT